MSHRTASRVAWSLWAATMALTAAAIVLVIATRSAPAPVALLFRGSESVLAVVTSTVGVVVASRRKSNSIGWLFLGAALSIGVLIFSEHYAVFALLAHPGAPGGTVAAWLQGWIGPLGFFPTLTLLMLLFPTGTLPSSRWRPLVWLTAVSAATFLAGWALRPGPLDVLTFVDNPIGLGGRSGEVASALADVGEVMLAGSMLLSASAVLVRFRRARGVERAQLKWLVSAAGLLASVVVAFTIIGPGDLPVGLDLLVLPAFASIPVACGIAIVRHRLFDIDRVISRTLSYAIVTAILGGLFVLVALVPTLLVGTEDSPDWIIAVATLLVVAAFRPVRRRVQSAVDRRFNRARYDAARTIEGFSARLREEIDLDTLRKELHSVVGRTMQPAHVFLWLPGARS